MARPGVTYQDIAKAATKLKEQNTRPSIEAVRRELGTGSNSTINRHLREWQNKQGNSMELEQGLPETLLIAIRGLYEAMGEKAKEKYTQLKTEQDQLLVQLKAKVETAEQCAHKMAQENKDLENKLAQIHEENSALQRMIAQLNKKDEEKIAENTLLTARLEDKKSEIERLTQQLMHTQSNLEHYREAMRQERVNEKREFDEKITGLDNKLTAQQTIAARAKEDVVGLKQQAESLETAKNTAIKEQQATDKQCQNYEKDLQQLNFSHSKLQEAHDKLSSHNNHLAEELDLNKIKYNELSLNAENYKARVEMLAELLKKAEDKLKGLADKHLFLTQEKAELAFQLKQSLASA